MDVRAGGPDDITAVMTVFDSGGLEVPADRVETALEADHVHVAVQEDRVLGAVLVDPECRADAIEIEAIAVRPGRRGQGIGRLLVRSVAQRHGPLLAAFEEPARPFWAALGFEITPQPGDSRYLARSEGIREPE
ncbi:MAG: GNAT family N-acetyltransferase [Halobacteriales archaeon]